jgi:hypothetical protein
LSNELFSRRNIAKLTLEGVVVVISILIAFALDAWWNDRQLQQETAEDLGIVQFELNENVRLIGLTTDIIDEVIAANNVLIAKLLTQPDSAMVEIDDTTVWWAMFNNPTLDLSFGATDAWIADGRLGALGSPILRQRLASVRGKVGDVVEEQHIAREISVREIYPLIMDEIGDIELVQEIVSAGLQARQRTSVQVINGSGTIPIPNSNALRFLLRARSLWYEASRYETRDFQAELEEIQSLLHDEMQRLSGGKTIHPLEQASAE